MASSEITVHNQEKLLEPPVFQKLLIKRIEVGDRVRMAKDKLPFSKGNEKRFTSETFIAAKVVSGTVTTYKLQDQKNKIVQATLYAEKLNKVSNHAL